jgi:carbonic anhydrase
MCATTSGGDVTSVPRAALAVLTCMDVRLEPLAMLALAPGDAHVLRNAGGIATDDTVRSLLLSQRLLGTRRLHVVHHTDCGLHQLDEGVLVSELRAEVGAAPAFSFGSFLDPAASARETAESLAESPFLAFDEVRAFVFDVATRELTEVSID